MKTCGINIKGNEAILVCLEGASDNYQQFSADLKKLKLIDSSDQEEVRSFHTTLMHFLKESNFDKIGIKERAKKGKFAGGPTSFKIEGLIQISDTPVVLLHPATVNAKLKGIQLDTSQINKYQEDAWKIAYYLLLE